MEIERQKQNDLRRQQTEQHANLQKNSSQIQIPANLPEKAKEAIKALKDLYDDDLISATDLKSKTLEILEKYR
jgi:hypothetical protein